MHQQGTICDFSGGDSWVILSPIEQSIKLKIESKGIPLKDWNINIYRGVLTGFNDAFIISTEKRKEILSRCKTDAEKKRTEELIRPILRGRDVGRYGYEWAGRWLINTHNGIKGRIPRIRIEDYPAVKSHLDNYWDQIKDRADQGDTPYNLRNCAYLEDFFKPKIVWARLMRLTRSDIDAFPRFCPAPEGMFTVDSLCFIVGEKLDHLISVLNSEYAAYYFFNNVATLDNGGFQMRQQYIENIPIPPDEYKGDACEAFEFTDEEKAFIADYVKLRKEEILDAER